MQEKKFHIGGNPVCVIFSPIIKCGANTDNLTMTTIGTGCITQITVFNNFNLSGI